MVPAYEVPQDANAENPIATQDRSAERALRDFRYVVSAVNDSALRAWEDLWKELQAGVTPGGQVGPEMQSGFKPERGWPEFLEKFWLLKHYLDYIHRFSKKS